jgi:hypothetical protein
VLRAIRGVKLRETTPGLSSMGVGSNWSHRSVDPNCRHYFAFEPTGGGRLFTAKLAVVLHYLPHQLLDDPTEAHAAAVRSAISGIRR